MWKKAFKADHISSNFLKAVFHKFYLVHSWILCPRCLTGFWILFSNNDFLESPRRFLRQCKALWKDFGRKRLDKKRLNLRDIELITFSPYSNVSGFARKDFNGSSKLWRSIEGQPAFLWRNWTYSMSWSFSEWRYFKVCLCF